MIRKVTIRRFKRWDEVTFDLPGHVVLAGPNNSGKTTLLQAIAAWAEAVQHWRTQPDENVGAGGAIRVPVGRLSFTAVQVRALELLWHGGKMNAGPIEIEVEAQAGWRLGMRFEQDTREQMFVVPTVATSGALTETNVRCVFVPPMTGVTISEPVFQQPKIDQVLAEGRPGDVIRNLLLGAHAQGGAWQKLVADVRELFDCDLIPPDSMRAHIQADYEDRRTRQRLDLASAGSGFQQTVMLLALLHANPGTVLLMDEPDAHLHINLQEAVYQRLRSLAARQGSQLIVATHAEAIIDRVALDELRVVVGQRPMKVSDQQRPRIRTALASVSQVEILTALELPLVLYVEDYTDIDILRAFAKVLGHPAQHVLERDGFWRATAPGRPPDPRQHHEALRLANPKLQAIEITDGDTKRPAKEAAEDGYRRLKWSRAEIESYLFHRAALDRFIEGRVGPAAAGEAQKAAGQWLEKQFPAWILADPLGDHAILKRLKASEDILPQVLHEAGLPEIRKNEFFAIAEVMTPDEVHPEIKQVLDVIAAAFAAAPVEP